jgi:hypothetical protein
MGKYLLNTKNVMHILDWEWGGWKVKPMGWLLIVAVTSGAKIGIYRHVVSICGIAKQSRTFVVLSASTLQGAGSRSLLCNVSAVK